MLACFGRHSALPPPARLPWKLASCIFLRQYNGTQPQILEVATLLGHTYFVFDLELLEYHTIQSNRRNFMKNAVVFVYATEIN